MVFNKIDITKQDHVKKTLKVEVNIQVKKPNKQHAKRYDAKILINVVA